MKRLILLSICCLAGIFMANAQKFALIDMEYILENIPAYQKANNELELASQQYKKTVHYDHMRFREVCKVGSL